MPSRLLSDHEPLAIVGMACRLPGSVSSPSGLWDLLVEGRSGLGDIPPSRFNKDAFYHPNAQHPASINSPGGYFIDDDIRSFDNEFFGINNLEAQYMDPQQRQLLEVAYECLESAGISLRNVSNSEIGCYVANFTTDYAVMQSKDPELYHRYSGTGMGAAIMANRISHAFNLKGPSMTIDTACSASVYALHLACTALRTRECDGAIVGGANLIQSPELYMGAVKAGMTSGTAMCHTFDIAADGYARAEGVGALYVKRLSDAIRDGDTIRSVIRGTAINSNGKTNGISLPSASGQEAVIRRAYENASLAPDSTDYIEAHGTGTEVGDGIEVAAFSRVLKHRSKRPMLIGSAKTNLGHGEAVSGITSIIKVTLALENGLIPKTIGVKTVNPKLRLDEHNAMIATENTPWPESDTWRASINSFGYGGSNGHVILEAARHHITPATDEYHAVSSAKCFLLPFSANSAEALEGRRTDFTESLIDEGSIEDLAYTLSFRRSHLPHRGYLIASSDSLHADLRCAQMQSTVRLEKQNPPAYLFIFTGQGSQWAGMGHQLMEEFPVFCRTISELASYLTALPDPPPWDLRDVIAQRTDPSAVEQALISQPACTAVQIALVELLRSLSISASTVVGHSSGEIAAAYAAGYLTAKQAILTAYYRGLAVSQKAPMGDMAAVGTDRDIARDLITKSGYGDHIEIACTNSPKSVTISGESAAIDEFTMHLQSEGVFARKLKTDNKAYHSRHMKLVSEEYTRVLAGVFKEKEALTIQASAKMISSVEAREVARRDVACPEYWTKNLESQVRYSDALSTALLIQDCHIIEVGPHSTLKSPTKDVCTAISRDVPYTPAVIRGKDTTVTILDLVGQLFLHGDETPIENLNSSTTHDGSNKVASHKQKKVLTHLPSYRWHRGPPLWSESRMSYEYRTRKHPRHDLLGSLTPGGSGQTVTWRNVLRVDDVPWLEDHKLGEKMVFPAAGYLAMAVEAFSQARPDLVGEGRSLMLRNVKFVTFLTFPDRRFAAEIFTELAPIQNSLLSASKSMYNFSISSFEAGVSTVHARGVITASSRTCRRMPPEELEKENMEQQTARTWYRRMQNEGLNFGDTFQRLADVYNDRSRETKRTVAIMEKLANEIQYPGATYRLHPAYIDALLQASIISTAAGTVEKLNGKIPVSIDSVIFHDASGLMKSKRQTIRAASKFEGLHTAVAHAELHVDDDLLLDIDGLQIIPWRRYHGEQDSQRIRQPMMEVEWKPDIDATNSGNTICFNRYLDQFVASHGSAYTNTAIARTAALVDLYCHKSPGSLRTLLVGHYGEADIDSFSNILGLKGSLKRAKSFHLGRLTAGGELECSPLYNSKEVIGYGQCIDSMDRASSEDAFDLIVATSSIQGTESISSLYRQLSHGGKMILPFVDDATITDHRLTLTYTTSKDTKSLTVYHKGSGYTNGVSGTLPIVLVSRTGEHPLDNYLKEHLPQYLGSKVSCALLGNVSEDNIPPRALIIATVELEDAMLAQMTDLELGALQIISKQASNIVWLQKSGVLNTSKPDMALTRGLFRTLVMEHPSLKAFIFDIGLVNSDNEMEHTLSHLNFIVDEALHNDNTDLEYVQRDGLLHISRFSPVDSLNSRFHQRSNRRPVPRKLADIGQSRLFLKDVGRFEAVCFVPTSGAITDLESTSVEVQTKAVGINAKDYYSLKGIVNTRDATCSLEFGGVITRVGSAVMELRPGDRVVAMAPNGFETYVRVPEWACCKLEDTENYAAMSTVPIVFSTALYALHHRAQIRAGESILIHSAAGGAGIAALQIAQLAGAKIFATVGTEEKKSFLVREFGLNPEWIFSSRDAAFLPAILEITNGNGVDVVLNSLTGDLLQASWDACSDFGRFVDISKRDSLDGGRLDMQPFLRNTSYHAFDLSGLYYSPNSSIRGIWSSLLKQSIEMVRSGRIRPVQPLRVFDVSELGQAFQHFASSSRIGKVAVSLQDPASQVQYLPEKYTTTLSPEKTYLMVGCLGGLGSTLSQWMVQRGARRLAFLGRSGAARPAARQQIEALRQAGAEVQVFQGDVASPSDVERAIPQTHNPIGGVVHAAMNLEEALFSQMTTAKWNSCTRPKVQGAWNLHQALVGHDAALDFFLTTSSVAGSVGLVTESNYCAANSFLDHFARYRRSLGLPAVSVGLGLISDVGYLHEHPEIEKTLLRKGIHPYTSDEVLQVIDIALSRSINQNDGLSSGPTTGTDRFSNAHILTGLELQGLQKILRKGFDAQNSILNDPRAGLLARALEASDEAQAAQEKKKKQGTGRRLQELDEALAALNSHSENSLSQLAELVEALVAETFANLLLLPVEKLKRTARLAELGMDSMLAAELRASVFKTFGVDVHFSTLLEEGTGIADLANIVLEGLLGSRSIQRA